jgi:serine protease DegS
MGTRAMNIGKTLTFVFHAITAGLAAAFVVVVFFPHLLSHRALLEGGASTPAAATGMAADRAGSYAEAVAQAAPAVVNIQARNLAGRPVPLLEHPPYRRSGGDGGHPGTDISVGSGVIVSARGHILTNDHLIAGAEGIEVLLPDGRKAGARVLGTDPDTDLAVLAIDLTDLPTIAPSEHLRVGDVALAIGNPFGVDQTVSMGIVGATGRSRLGFNTPEDFIRTDAAINPENSGGALVNARGQLIGINTALFPRAGPSEGDGFAVPAGLATEVMRQIIDKGHVARGWLGIELQGLTPALAESFGLGNTHGVAVARVVTASPAERAGLAPGDVITAIGGVPIADRQAALDGIAARAPGSEIALRIVRSGAERTLSATVAERPAGEDP